jgi:hypothetical protein
MMVMTVVINAFKLSMLSYSNIILCILSIMNQPHYSLE